MTTATTDTRENPLPDGAVPIRVGGLLSRVTRECTEHGGEAVCVARDAEGRLIYRCERGAHHFTTRAC